MTPPVVLTIAGSDSGGGAGIQADLKTIAALGAYGVSVVTAITAQNTTGVSAIHSVPAEIVAKQLDAVLGDFPVAAVKVGMIGDPEVAEVVAAYAPRLPELVVDPVLVATSGARLSQVEFVRSVVACGKVVTPNRAEAAALVEGIFRAGPGRRHLPRPGLGWVPSRAPGYDNSAAPSTGAPSTGPPSIGARAGRDMPPAVTEGVVPAGGVTAGRASYTPESAPNQGPRSAPEGPRIGSVRASGVVDRAALAPDFGERTSVPRLAAAIAETGPEAVVITGSESAVDVLWIGGEIVELAGEPVETANNHGSGCTFSSAIAVRLAMGDDVTEAVRAAKSYVTSALRGGRDWRLGAGPGPLDHFF